MKKRICGAILSLFMLSGCVSLEGVSLTQIPSDRRRIVVVREEKIIFLTHFSTQFVNNLSVKLREKCRSGEVKGILTKDESIWYFPFIHKRRITATGYCIQ